MEIASTSRGAGNVCFSLAIDLSWCFMFVFCKNTTLLPARCVVNGFGRSGAERRRRTLPAPRPCRERSEPATCKETDPMAYVRREAPGLVLMALAIVAAMLA